jgi:DNA-binding transcriptional MerR regulator
MKIGINPQCIDVRSGLRRIAYQEHPERFLMPPEVISGKGWNAVCLKESALGLLYELRVYNEIISPMLDAEICPNFLRSMLVSYNCTYQDLTKTLQKGLPGKLTMRDVKNRFNRSLSYMTTRKNGRPPIHASPVVSVDGTVPQYPRPDSSIRFMVLTTEFDDVESYFDWLFDPLRRLEPEFGEERNAVALQLFIALYAMQCCKLMHGDLHAGNIFIQTLPQEEVLQYKIEGQKIAFKVKSLLKVYDYDNASCLRLGDNLHVTAPMTGVLKQAWYRQSPSFEPNRDLAGLCNALDKNVDYAGIGQSIEFDLTIPKQASWSNAQGAEVITPLLEAITNAAGFVDQEVWDPTLPVYRINQFMFNPDGSFNKGHKRLRKFAVKEEQMEQKEQLLSMHASEYFECDQIRQSLEGEVADLEDDSYTEDMRAEAFQKQNAVLKESITRLEKDSRTYCTQRLGERFDPRKAAYCGVERDLSPTRRL